MPREDKQRDLVQGTLHMLILKTLALEPMHGYGIGIRLDRISRGVFQVNPGSLFPAFRRLERDGLDRRRMASHREQPPREVYELTAPDGRTLKHETRDWEAQTAADFEDSSKHSLGEL